MQHKQGNFCILSMFVPVPLSLHVLYGFFLLSLSPGLYKLERRLAFFNNAQLQTQTKAALICRTLTKIQNTMWTHRQSLRNTKRSQKQVPFWRCEQVIAGPQKAARTKVGFLSPAHGWCWSAGDDPWLWKVPKCSESLTDSHRFTVQKMVSIDMQVDGWCLSLGIAHFDTFWYILCLTSERTQPAGKSIKWRRPEWYHSWQGAKLRFAPICLTPESKKMWLKMGSTRIFFFYFNKENGDSPLELGVNYIQTNPTHWNLWHTFDLCTIPVALVANFDLRH